MAKRGFKLFALALSILVGRSFLALVEIPQTTQHRYRRPSKTARSVEPPDWAAYLEPIVTVVGISLKDLANQFFDARRIARSLNELNPLVDVNDAYEHAGVLANKLLEGVSSIYAEPGVGKSVAVVLAMLGWAEGNPNSITVLVQENLKLLNDFFRVSDEAYIPAVAANLFRILSDRGVRLQLVLDNVFDEQLGEDGKMLMSLARAAFEHGQVVVVTQSREVAEKVGSLNGARTRVSSQQKCNVSQYRWNEMQASRLLLNLNATAKLNKMLLTFTSTTKEPEDRVQRALNESLEAFSQDGAWVQENLEGARMPDGGWKPVDIKQFLISGIKPVLVPPVAGTTFPTQNKPVWVRQLQKEDGEIKEADTSPFKIKESVADVDDLKEAIKKKEELSIAASKLEVRSLKDGRWEKEDADAEINRGTSMSDCYGYLLPD
eukprot:symbB.v1.2.041382.t1/scaffold8117.1/size13801/1